MSSIDTAAVRDRWKSGRGATAFAASHTIWSLCAEIDRLRAQLAASDEQLTAAWDLLLDQDGSR